VSHPFPTGDLPRDRHGAPDATGLAPEPLRRASARYDALLDDITTVDPITIELVRLRNAHRQGCNL
jgi:hypothetical protein